MRKSFVIFAALVLGIVYSVPASAKVHVGGIVFMDAYMHDADKDHVTNAPTTFTSGTDDWQQTELEIPDITRLFGKWTNDAGDVGMHIELGLGNPNASQVQSNSVRLRLAYGWWMFSPGTKLVVGQTHNFMSPLNASQLLGWESGGLHLHGRGFGNIHSGRQPLVGLDMKFGDAYGLKVALVEPRNAADISYPGAAGNEETTIPRLDAVLSMKFGSFAIYPSISYVKVEFEETAGADNSYAITCYSLGIKYASGPFTASGEYNFGQNWRSSTYLIIVWEAGPQMNGNTIEDTDNYGYWVDLAYKTGAATIHAIYGSQGSESWSTQGDVERERTMYGISVPISVAETFIIRPEYMIYDWGQIKTPGAADTKLGEETIAGVQFQIKF
jgi:hypothetical protein